MTKPPPLELYPRVGSTPSKPRPNDAFAELLGLLQARCAVTSDALVEALFVIRAHQNLAAIIPCCEDVDRMVHAFPEFQREPLFTHQAQRLQLLREIGQLKVSRKSHLGVHRVKSKVDPRRGLRPWTGDSGVCDLVLSSTPWWKVTDPAILRVKAWFLWQIMQHQARNESLDAYRGYLLGGRSRALHDSVIGGRIAAATRSLCDLCDRDAQGQVRTLASLCEPLTEAHSKELLTVLGTALQRDYGVGSDDLLASERAPADPIVTRRSSMLQQFSAIAQRPDTYHPGVDLMALKYFLEAVWEHLATRSRVGGARRHHIAPLAAAPAVQRFGQLVTVTQPVNGDGVQDGTAIDIYERQDQTPTGARGKRGAKRHGEATAAPPPPAAWTDDPEDEPPVEPAVTLFLGTRDALSGWYAARSAAHHIERENAWLRWPNWRLSSDAIQALLACIADAKRPAEAAWGRLALGLSLVSGRALARVSAAYFVESGGKLDAETVAIRTEPYVLEVPAGSPQLQSIAPATVQAYCHPHVATLRLPLPQAWASLLDQLRAKAPPAPDAVIHAAKVELASFAAGLEATERSIAGALKLALLEAGRGDLGLVKVVTDTDAVNFNNIIHYAAYARSDVERRWRKIVHGWAGSLYTAPVEIPESAVAADVAKGALGAGGRTARQLARAAAAGGPTQIAGPHVGTPYGIEIDKVAPHVALLKQHFQEAVAAADWAAVNNLLTLYVAVWFGLATAGRSAREPVPGIVLADGWALIRDKHRPDESTDRYVPLGQSVRAQLAVLRGLTAALGLARAEFSLPRAGGEHLLRLQLVQLDGRITPFQPKDMQASEALRNLPGNWGRKVVRSCVADLPGRFLDAGLGHWVRGRHPWSLTSTFPAQVFRRQWLALQERLEHALGFEVLTIPELPAYSERSTPSAPPRVLPEPAVDPVAAVAANAEADEATATLLANCHGEVWYDQVFTAQPPSAQAALRLGEWAVAHADSALGADRAETAVRVCSYIRARTRIPLFAIRPRARFQRNWLVKRSEFAALAYVEQVLLPGILDDLSHLPARPSLGPAEPGTRPDGDSDRAKNKARQQAQRAWRPQKIAAGRLIVALALRGGVLNTMHLDTTLVVLADSTPLLAVGTARLLELAVVSRRARDPMRRTLLLEPYLAALVSLERDWVRPWLRTAAADDVERRQAHWNAALHAYLRRLGLPTGITLAMLLLALRQRIQLQATPLLAAYASGELLTQDLSLHEFARLAGGILPATLIQEQATSAKAARDRIAAKIEAGPSPPAGPGAEKGALPMGSPSARRKRGQHGRNGWLESPVPEAVDMGVPDDLRSGAADLATRLCECGSEQPRAWLQRIDAVSRTAHEPLAKLLCAFAADLIRVYVGRGGHRDRTNREVGQQYQPRPGELALPAPDKVLRTRLSGRFQAWARMHLMIVWAGLTGFSSEAGGHRYLDEAVVQALAESTAGQFKERHHLAAWSRFRSYLIDPQADHAGFEIGPLSAARPRPVSAKILSRSELARAAAYLGSVRSGIGALHTRTVAGRHFALTQATGARRAESAELRWADVAGDCLRIRPYAGHTLKTPAAERTVPRQLVAPALWRELLAGRTGNTRYLIDLPGVAHVEGANFFDSEARAIKHGGHDQDLGPHHLRHTKANALLLQMLANCVDLGLLQGDLPWVAGLLPSDCELAVLLGTDGQCGQGLQAISMLLGHLHPTTTLHHYLHTLGVALYAYQLGQPDIGLPRAFAGRVPGRATLYRRASVAGGSAQAARRVRDQIEAIAEKAHRASGATVPLVVPMESGYMAPVPGRTTGAPALPDLRRSDPVSATPAVSSVHGWTVAQLEGWQRYFGDGAGAAPAAATAMRSALAAIRQIPSGKRGAHQPRHPLPVRGADGVCLPAMIRSASEALHAHRLLDWLARLEQARPGDYAWLLDKWLYASDVQQGSMGLAGEAEVARARVLLPDPWIAADVFAGRISAGRQRTAAKPGWRLQLRLRRAALRDAQADTGTTVATATGPGRQRSPWAGRTTSVVRWVLTWLAVARGGLGQPIIAGHPIGVVDRAFARR